MIFTKKHTKHIIQSRGGFILPLTMLLTTLIMLVSFGITSIIVRQARFSRIVKDSFIAYNAADMAVSCASYIDDSYQDSGSNSLFPSQDVSVYAVASSTNEITAVFADYNTTYRTGHGLPTLGLNDVNCAGESIFDASSSNITYTAYDYTPAIGSVQHGKKSTFNLTFPLSNGDFRCAKVIMNRTSNYRQIIASGYSTCDTTSDKRLERVIVSNSE
jgi:Tfp pilus assembly protein PilX